MNLMIKKRAWNAVRNVSAPQRKAAYMEPQRAVRTGPGAQEPASHVLMHANVHTREPVGVLNLLSWENEHD